MEETTSFSAFVRNRRLNLGLSLREFCRENGLDVGNMSRMERGLSDPPKAKAAQQKLARALQLRQNSEDWNTFVELAAISAGRIPPGVMSDKELLPKLPLFFRTVKGKRLTREQLKQLAELIRE